MLVLVSSVSYSQNNDIVMAEKSLLNHFKSMSEHFEKTNSYSHSLNFVFESSKNCLKERSIRLKSDFSDELVENLIIKNFGADKYNKYKEISKGYHFRVSGLEVLACDAAGLKNTVSILTASYNIK